MDKLDPMAVAQSRYRYVRVIIEGKDASDKPVEVILGVEITPGVHVEKMYHDIRAQFLLPAFQQYLPYADDEFLALAAESIILRYWPKRSYFIEVGRGELKEYVQVFAP